MAGPGSLIDASSIQTITNANTWRQTYFTAENGGVLDFSGVQTIDGGGFHSSGSAIRNNFSIASGGELRFGDVVLQQNNSFSIDGNSSVLSFDGVAINSGSIFVANNLATLASTGSIVHQHQTEGRFNFDGGRVLFDLEESVQFEIAGENRGLTTNGLNNFGFQQLMIGDGLHYTTLVVADEVNNGNRLNGLPEVLYLLDVNGEGLLIRSGSRLVLNGNDVFVSNGTNSFVSLRDMIAIGVISIPFDEGSVALTGEVGEVINGSFGTDSLVGFNVLGDGAAAIVNSPHGPEK